MSASRNPKAIVGRVISAAGHKFPVGAKAVRAVSPRLLGPHASSSDEFDASCRKAFLGDNR